MSPLALEPVSSLAPIEHETQAEFKTALAKQYRTTEDAAGGVLIEIQRQLKSLKLDEWNLSFQERRGELLVTLKNKADASRLEVFRFGVVSTTIRKGKGIEKINHFQYIGRTLAVQVSANYQKGVDPVPTGGDITRIVRRRARSVVIKGDTDTQGEVAE